MVDIEIALTGGRTTPGVVRIGDTVRKAQSSNSFFVQQLLDHLAARDFKGSPRYLGIDDRGRDIMSFLDGIVPIELGEFTERQLTAASRLLRALHDNTRDCDLKKEKEIVCHGDASPCNFVFRDGMPYALIDFDAAHPGARSDDLGYAAWHWLDIGNEALAPEDQGRRLAKFFADYGPANINDPVSAVIASQTLRCAGENGNTANRVWAQECLRWTETNCHILRRSFVGEFSWSRA